MIAVQRPFQVALYSFLVVIMAVVMTVVGVAPVGGATISYYAGSASLGAWKYSSVDSHVGGTAFGASEPYAMYVSTRTASTGTSTALGGVTQTYTRRTTRNECAWTSGWSGPPATIWCDRLT